MIYQMINKIKETSGSLLIRFQNFKDVTLLLKAKIFLRGNARRLNLLIIM